MTIDPPTCTIEKKPHKILVLEIYCSLKNTATMADYDCMHAFRFKDKCTLMKLSIALKSIAQIVTMVQANDFK